MSGKGSAPRPYSVPKETFDQSFERIFGITCKRCGKRGLKQDSVHTCSPQINGGRKPIKTQEQMHEWLSVALKDKP